MSGVAGLSIGRYDILDEIRLVAVMLDEFGMVAVMT